MSNFRMQRKIRSGDAIDVSRCAREGNYYVLDHYEDGADYCNGATERWIWSIGVRHSDGKILASHSSDLYENAEYDCVWLR